jgi:hypothetical protein
MDDPFKDTNFERIFRLAIIFAAGFWVLILACLILGIMWLSQHVTWS